MIRVQIQFEKRQMDRLKQRAAQENMSVSELVRKATDAWLRAEREVSPDDLRRRAIAAAGRYGSGKRDVAERHDAHLAEIWRE